MHFEPFYSGKGNLIFNSISSRWDQLTIFYKIYENLHVSLLHSEAHKNVITLRVEYEPLESRLLEECVVIDNPRRIPGLVIGMQCCIWILERAVSHTENSVRIYIFPCLQSAFSRTHVPCLWRSNTIPWTLFHCLVSVTEDSFCLLKLTFLHLLKLSPFYCSLCTQLLFLAN